MGNNGVVSNTNFTSNTAKAGGAIYWEVTGSMIKCNFYNKWIQSNGIYAKSNLNINDGEGIVDIIANGTLSGISIITLNNPTYFCSPNENINF